MMHSLFAFALCAVLATASYGYGYGPTCPTLNLCYAIDESGSIDATEFQQQTDALVAITEQFSQLAGGSVFSAVGFSTSAELISAPTSDVAAFIEILKKNPKKGGGTSSGSGLNLCEEQLRTLSDPRVILLITDGQDGNNPRGTNVAPAIKASGITIAAVGVGNGVNTNTLQNSIASSPDLYTPVSDFSALQTAVANIVNALCKEVTPPTPTTTASATASPSLTSSPSASVSVSASPTISVTPSTSVSVSASPTISVTPSASASVSTTPSVSASPSASPSPSASEPAVPPCAQVQCGKCGSRLECYVNSGSSKLDHAVCAIVTNRKKFCPKKVFEWDLLGLFAKKPNFKTFCGQKCGSVLEPLCVTGKSWPVCPAVITPRGGYGGYGHHPESNGCLKKKWKVSLKSFASYKVCVDGSRHPVWCTSKICKHGECDCPW